MLVNSIQSTQAPKSYINNKIKTSNQINKSTNMNDMVSFGSKVSIAEGIIADCIGRNIKAYEIQIDPHNTIRITENLENKGNWDKVKAEVIKGKLDFDLLPEPLAHYYEKCLDAAKKYFKTDTVNLEDTQKYVTYMLNESY